MKEIVFATNNDHKISEIRKLVPSPYQVLGLKEKGIFRDIPEDHPTLEENALQKANFIFQEFGYNCFADDTGLEIEALQGEPGVFSARYSRVGSPVYPDMDVTEGNIRKVLEKLENKKERQARFRTVIALIIGGEQHFFEGVIEGEITASKSGFDGFGYDPIFIPDGYTKTFAEMTINEKNRISHRALAVNKLVQFLLQYHQE